MIRSRFITEVSKSLEIAFIYFSNKYQTCTSYRGIEISGDLKYIVVFYLIDGKLCETKISISKRFFDKTHTTNRLIKEYVYSFNLQLEQAIFPNPQPELN